MEEIDEISHEDLEAAVQMYDDLVLGVFYEKQEASGFPIKYIGGKDGREIPKKS